MRRGEKDGCRRHDGTGRLSWGETEESKIRDNIIEGGIIGLKRNQALGRFPNICKDDTNRQSKQQRRGYLKCSLLIMRLMTNSYAIV